MDSILSTVLSAFVHNPILILAIIGYIVFSFLKSSKNEDADEYENSGAEKTWEDMEREYGIPIQRKLEEVTSVIKERHEEKPATNAPIQVLEQTLEKIIVKRNADPIVIDKPVVPSIKANDMNSGVSLTERLAEFKRQKTMEEGKVLLNDIGAHVKPITTKKNRKSRSDIKEGMKWAFILEKPKALRHRAR